MSVCDFVCLSLWMSVNTIIPEPLEILSRNFRCVMLCSNGKRHGVSYSFHACRFETRKRWRQFAKKRDAANISSDYHSRTFSVTACGNTTQWRPDGRPGLKPEGHGPRSVICSASTVIVSSTSEKKTDWCLGDYHYVVRVKTWDVAHASRTTVQHTTTAVTWLLCYYARSKHSPTNQRTKHTDRQRRTTVYIRRLVTQSLPLSRTTRTALDNQSDDWKTRRATRSCRTRKRAFHLFVRCRPTQALCGAARTARRCRRYAAAADGAVYNQFAD